MELNSRDTLLNSVRSQNDFHHGLPSCWWAVILAMRGHYAGVPPVRMKKREQVRSHLTIAAAPPAISIST